MSARSTKAPASLTTAQKKEAVTIFKRGTERYTDLTAELTKVFGKDKITYQAVNTFMTKWKRKEGIIQRRSERSDKKNPTRQAPVQNLNNNSLPEIMLEELKMLRNFYDKFKNTIGNNPHA